MRRPAAALGRDVPVGRAGSRSWIDGVVVAVVLVLGAAACSGSSDTRGTVVSAVPTSDGRGEVPRTSVLDAVLTEPKPASPLAVLLLDPSAEAQAYAAWQHLIRTCMDDAGFDFVVLTLDEVQEVTRPALTAAEVQAHGYNLITETPRPTTATEQRLASDEQYRRALLGDEVAEDDGCVGEARRTTYEHRYWELDEIVRQAEIDASVTAAASDERSELDARWSACMAERGFQYAAPDEPPSEYVGQPVDDVHVATKWADLECQASVDYTGSVAAAEAALAEAWLAGNPSVVEELGTVRPEYERYIGSLLAGS